MRLKGYILVDGTYYLCQYASGNFEYESVTEIPINAFVVIGKNINRQALAEIF